jgi:hypothetical protein
MIALYCHGNRHELPCAECEALEDYALQRLDKCPYGNEKTFLQRLPHPLLQTGHAGKNQRSYAVFRSKNVVEVSVACCEA